MVVLEVIPATQERLASIDFDISAASWDGFNKTSIPYSQENHDTVLVILDPEAHKEEVFTFT